MKTVLTFLGKARDGYSSASYQFQEKVFQCKFFGQAVIEAVAPESVVILGTNGSMWDVLLEHLPKVPDFETEEEMEFRAKLEESSQSNSVTQSQVDHLATILKQSPLFKHVKELHLEIIPVGRDESEQYEIVSHLTKYVAEGSEVHLDVTHGLRSTSMLGFVAASFLSQLKGARIGGLYYGAFELRDSNHVTPVIDLSGLLELQEWISRLKLMETTGDARPVADALSAQNWISDEAKSSMNRGSFYERVMHVGYARRDLMNASNQLSNAKPESTSNLAELVIPQIVERLEWTRQPEKIDWLLSRARHFCDLSDFVRSSIYIFEAWVTIHEEEAGYEFDHDQRKQLTDKLAKENMMFRLFRQIRNSLAHGAQPSTKQAQKVLSSRESLSAELLSNINFLSKKLNKKGGGTV